MVAFKQTALRFILVAELIIVTFFYLGGSGGIVALRYANAVNSDLLKDIALLQDDLKQLTKELDERKINPFYQERIARKELKMAYKDETVYLLPESTYV